MGNFIKKKEIYSPKILSVNNEIKRNYLIKNAAYKFIWLYKFS